MNIEAFMNVLPVIGYGLIGIFIVFAIILLFIKGLNKLFKPKANELEQ